MGRTEKAEASPESATMAGCPARIHTSMAEASDFSSDADDIRAGWGRALLV